LFLLPDIKDLTVGTQMQRMVLFILAAHFLAAKLELVEVEIMLAEGQFIDLLLYLNVEVVVALRCPSLPDHRLVEVAPALLFEDYLWTSDQSQGALERLGGVTGFREGNETVRLLVAEQIKEQISHSDILNDSDEMVIAIGG
jgi:hypothetical protein